MDNNKINYQEYTFPKLLEQYDMILVPMIQRDYAQGRSDKKATDVRKNLLNDIFSGNEVHFDLVFGSVERRIVDGAEKRCFIPIDGQQRLTTLFLLYLYGQRQLSLYQELDLSKFTYDTRRAASDFCKSITREEWIIKEGKSVSEEIKDASWFMDYWAKDPTVDGMLNMMDAIHENAKEKGYPNLENVKFYFFDLESNGLNENLYLKMNSRGKPLTAFENLKAKMEKVLPDNIEIDVKWFPEDAAAPDSFKEKWKFFMDRNWTETFWDKDHPDIFDESIAKFIVRFLSGYWAAFGKDDKKAKEDELKKINEKENYADFIPFEPIENILKLDGAFSKLAHALTVLIDDSKIKAYWSKENDTIEVSDKSGYKLLAVVFTYVLFNGDKSAMRFAWNMAENYVSGYNNFITYCKRAKEIHNKYKPEENNAFYKILSNNGFNDPSDQLKEEISKAKQILDENGDFSKYDGSLIKKDGSKCETWEDAIKVAEETAFFKGAIRFLFTDEKGQVNDESWDNFFDTKWGNAQKYFGEEGEFDYNCLLRTLISYFQTKEQFQSIYYDYSHWRDKVLLNKSIYTPVHLLLTKDIMCDFDNYESKCENEKLRIAQNQLVKSDLIEILPIDGYYMEDDLRLHVWYHNRDKTDVLLGDSIHNNCILSKLINEKIISCSQRVRESNFFYGFNIDFEYNNHPFRWYGNPNEEELDVYLMGKNEKGDLDYWPRNHELPEETTENKNWFCFRVDENTTPDSFTEMLDCLIHQAEADEQNKPCYNDCQNKINSCLYENAEH